MDPVVVRRLRAAGCVFAEKEAALLAAEATTPSELDQMVAARVSGVPLEHVLGWAEFCGLRIEVDAGVFVPRRRTELLAREAAARAAAAAPPAVVVDLCCGSGAVGAAVASVAGRIELHASDVHPGAVQCARRNLAPAGARVHEGDLYDALPADLRGRIVVLVANVPYVPTGAIATMPPEARDHEPAIALDGGADGLGVLRRVTAAAPGWLAPGGWLLVETGERQAPAALETFRLAGLDAQVVSDPDIGATVVAGRRPGEREPG
jgi:release factor glutamine methyltransferase